jgi:murein DD-endopeptidase MepM/ murein hydrolase activator NlpD
MDTVLHRRRAGLRRPGRGLWSNGRGGYFLNFLAIGSVGVGGTMTGQYLEGDWQERSRWVINRLFPERQLVLRTEGRISYLRLSKTIQMSLVFLVLLAGGWIAFTSVNYSLHDKVLAGKENEIAHARLAYHSLLNEVVEYQKKFTSINRDLEENHALMLGLVERNATLQQNLKSVENQLTSTEQDRARVVSAREGLKGKLAVVQNEMLGLVERNAALQENLKSVENQLTSTELDRVRVVAAREGLKDQLAGIQNEMGTLTNRNLSLKDNLGVIETDLQTALLERNQALFDGTRMRRRIRELEGYLDTLQGSELETVQRLTDQTVAQIEDMQKVMKLAGLKADRVLDASTFASRGQGGPFIEAKPDALPANRLRADLAILESHLQHSAALKATMAKIPLTAPLNSFYVTSRFGKRRDPINKRWAAHYGVDLGSIYKSRVYVTAPGVVTYVGWKGKYGKFIEVDHGAGITTRYGHLHKTFVKKGQKVKFRDKIGLLGSTGRSTGAHLHYEVLFKNKAKNPMNFMKAGKYVFQE